MSRIDPFVSELIQEGLGARRVLERIPAERFDWRPHEKSFTFRELGSHVVDICGWADVTLHKDGVDVDAGSFRPFSADDLQDLLDEFEAKLETALNRMQGYPDGKLDEPWKLTMQGQTVFEMPRVEVLRGMILNHLVHHRAQLTVYLRLCDVPVPALYGPSADEQPSSMAAGQDG